MVWKKVATTSLTYGEWEDISSSVRAFVFAEMVELARNRVQYYRSDLYHDALWLEKRLNGPMQIEWVARESGTFIGESATQVKLEDWPQAVRYRFEILQEERLGRWVLNTYESFPDDRVCTSDDPTNHQGDTCPIHEDPELVSPIQVVIDEVFGNFPTLRNDSTVEQDAPIRKVNKMDDILNSLRDKLSEVSDVRDELETLQREIEDALENAQNNIDSLEEAINALDINLEDIDIEANISFDGSY